MEKATKAKLIEEIQNLPDGSTFVFVAAEPAENENENAQMITAIGCNLADLAGFICEALHDAFIEAGIKPRAGRAYAEALCKTVFRSCADASAEVLKNLPADEREAELRGMLSELLDNTEEGQTDAEE